MKLLTPSLLLICAFVIGGLIFKGLAPTDCAPILPNDNIFVLTGDVRRIPFALRQVEKYPNSNLYIIGAGGNVPTAARNRCQLETESKSTYQNALAIKKIASEKNLDRVVIITTEDHMNRAKYLVANELPSTQIVACPARLTGMPVAKRLERWTVEYMKYIVTLFGIKEG